MPLFEEEDQDSLYFSRFDEEHPLSSVAAYPFELDDQTWTTAEHYAYALQFKDKLLQQKIRNENNIHKALKIGKFTFWKKYNDWKIRRQTLMTRALYTQYKTYPIRCKFLLETRNQRLVENSAYDYFWGCGRDRRGLNTYGKVLMNIRSKLSSELARSDSN